MKHCMDNKEEVLVVWHPDLSQSPRPLYRALADALDRDIAAGALKAGDRLPPHRDLADALGMNVTTVTRGYQEAERRGLVSSTVGRGTFVAADARQDKGLGTPGEEKTLAELGLVLPLHDGEPDPELLLRDVGKHGLGKRLCRYADPAGLPDHREAAVLWLRRFGIESAPEGVLICAGAQHALTCALMGLFRPGDRIAVDPLTYPGIKALGALLGIRLIPVEGDEDGMLPEALDGACRRDAIAGIYLMPEVQNPTTGRLTRNRRHALGELIRRRDLILLEDESYAFTRETPEEPLTTLIPERSVYIAGVSKVLYAGLRTAFVAAPGILRSRLVHAVQNTLWMAPPLGAALFSAALRQGTVERAVREKRDEAFRRNTRAREILTPLVPAGFPTGFFLWLTLPEPWTGRDVEHRARERGIQIFGAERFAVGGTEAPRAIRISLTGTPTEEGLARSLERLRAVLTEEVPEGGATL